MSEQKLQSDNNRVRLDITLQIGTFIDIINNNKMSFINYVPILKHSLSVWRVNFWTSMIGTMDLLDVRDDVTTIFESMVQIESIPNVDWLALSADKVTANLEQLRQRILKYVQTNSSVEEIIHGEISEDTITETEMNKMFKKISNVAPENDKMAWRRLRRELTKNLDLLEELNQEYFAIQAKRKPILEHIDELREKMTTECVHPADELVYKGTHVLCKFCNKRLRLLNG